MKGFTLIETLVAIAILALAVAGPMYAANRALVAAQNSRNQLTAAHLAQEGIEYVRRLRDNQYLISPGRPDDAWDAFRNSGSPTALSTCTAGAPCRVDVLANTMNGTIAACGASCPLYMQSSTGRYAAQPTSGYVVTPFTRKVHLNWNLSERAADVVSRVEWTFKGVAYNVEIINTLRPWGPPQ